MRGRAADARRRPDRIAAQAVGIAQAALELATGYAKERNAFGGPIARFRRSSEAGRHADRDRGGPRLAWRAARLKEAGRPQRRGRAGEALRLGVARRRTGEAIQVLGGYG